MSSADTMTPQAGQGGGAMAVSAGHARLASKTGSNHSAQSENQAPSQRVLLYTKVGGQVLKLVAADIEEHVARVERAVELTEQVGRAKNEACAAVPARPRHAVELYLKLAKRTERVSWIERAEVFHGSGGAKQRARHRTNIPSRRVEVVAAD
eukprot:4245798-Pleurochrysis_carterae.AAC.2